MNITFFIVYSFVFVLILFIIIVSFIVSLIVSLIYEQVELHLVYISILSCKHLHRIVRCYESQQRTTNNGNNRNNNKIPISTACGHGSLNTPKDLSSNILDVSKQKNHNMVKFILIGHHPAKAPRQKKSISYNI